MNIEPIVIERKFDAPVSVVWKALTDKNEMKKWYFDLVEFKPERGFAFSFTGGTPDGIQHLHLCEITEVIHEKKLTYGWKYDGYEGNSFVTWELFEEGNQTLLRLTHRGLETLPQDNPDFAVTNFVEGWNQIIHTSLNNYLQKLRGSA